LGHCLQCFFFEYNGDLAVVCCCKLGRHEADLEHVTMRVKKETQSLVAVYFSAHKSLDGQWRYVGNMEEETGPNGEIHPVVYVALNSHACYPTTGMKLRILGFANDMCHVDESSLTWRPKVMLHLADLDWSDYAGCWGGSGSGKDKGNVSGFAGTLPPGEPTTSDNCCRRLCCCCCNGMCCLTQGWLGGAMKFAGLTKAKPSREKQGNTN